MFHKISGLQSRLDGQKQSYQIFETNLIIEAQRKICDSELGKLFVSFPHTFSFSTSSNRIGRGPSQVPSLLDSSLFSNLFVSKGTDFRI